MQRCKRQIFVPRLRPRFDVNNDGHTLYFHIGRPSDHIPRVSGTIGCIADEGQRNMHPRYADALAGER